MNTVSVIGTGTLATVFADLLRTDLPDCRLVSALGRTEDKTVAFSNRFHCASYINLQEFLSNAAPVVVEFAGVAAVRDYVLPVLETGRIFVCLSAGALADSSLLRKAREVALKNGGRLCIINGAVGGLDFLQTTALKNNDRTVVIETTKSPKSLEGAPGLNGKKISTNSKETIFEGSVSDAIKGFPKNINVGVIVSLASENPSTLVRIVSDPDATGNTHRIYLRSAVADADMSFSGKPDPNNPKSSVTAAMSACAFLRNYYAPVTYW